MNRDYENLLNGCQNQYPLSAFTIDNSTTCSTPFFFAKAAPAALYDIFTRRLKKLAYENIELIIKIQMNNRE